jgi:hypothetical protein
MIIIIITITITITKTVWDIRFVPGYQERSLPYWRQLPLHLMLLRHHCLVTPKPRERPPKKKTKKKQNQQDREVRREALLESATITDSPLPGSPLGSSILALLSPASVASVSSSLRSSNHNRKRSVGDTDNNNNNTPSKLLCMAGDELENDLATILDIRSENLVETMTILLSKLNDSGVAIDEYLTVESETAAAEARSISRGICGVGCHFSSRNSGGSSNGGGNFSSSSGNSSRTTATTTGSIH